MAMTRVRTALATLAALALVPLSGCGPQPESSTPASRLDSATIDMITDSGTFPTLRYLVDRATDRATEQCMRASGVNWSAIVGKPPSASDEERILDPAARKQHGYGFADGGEPTPRGADDPRVDAAMVGSPPRYATLTVLGAARYTYPVTGCLAQARAAVVGDVATWMRISVTPQEINMRLAGAVPADPRYPAAQQRWRRCMADHHLPYSTPVDLRRHLVETNDTTRDEEIRLAVQDARCDHEARLSLTELSLRRSAAQLIDPAQCTEMIRLYAAFAKAVTKAQALLK
jgi:hypothetical protein